MDFELSQDRHTWYPAVLPGGVHESLLAAGVIEHPHFGDNEASGRWVEDAEWWYRTRVTVAAADATERVTLVLPSVDTVADIWIDDELVASSANAFVPVEIDVSTGLDDAELLVRFTPPLQGLEPFEQPAAGGVLDPFGTVPSAPEVDLMPVTRMRRRKPTYSWGWDFGPRLPSVGLLEQPYVRRTSRLTADLHVRTLHVDVEKAVAQVAIDVEVDAFAVSGDLTATVTLTSPSGLTTPVELALTGARTSVVLPVTRAELWWTHDLGTPALYDVMLAVHEEGDPVLELTTKVGLRTLELDRSADPEQPGRFFRFVLNGIPTYSRGANWVPPSTMRGSVTAQTLRRLVETARRGEMTMLRIWGGGAYEQKAFYDACDELGVLVWQDFMFACVNYPSADRALQDEVAREAEFQVRRLRNHASLALWCGNNEVQALRHLLQTDLEPGDWGWHFFHGILPDAVSRTSPGALYWPGSPWADSDPAVVNGVHDGDRHAWEVWHGMDIGAGGPTEFGSMGEQVHWARYDHDLGRFISEFGIHASPEQPTLERWTPEGSLSLRSPAFDGRNKDSPKDKGWALMDYETGEPSSLVDYIDFSMACQAEGLKSGVEHYRRRQPHNSGTLVWQFNDVWPGFSWSVLDHDLTPKAGFYALQRAYRTVIASFRFAGDTLELWVTNSGRTEQELRLVVEVEAFTGETVTTHDVHVVSAPYSSFVAWSGLVDRVPERFAWVSSPDGSIEPNRLFFGRLKELPLAGVLEARVSGSAIELTAQAFCYAARVTTPVPGAVCDVNYLDLRKGETRTIALSGLPDGFDLTQLEVRTYGGTPVLVKES